MMKYILFILSFSLYAAGKIHIAVMGETSVKAEIESLLVKSEFAQPVEREKLDAALRELKLSQSGLLQGNSAAEAGKLTEADYFIFVENDRSFRLVHTRSGKVYGSWKEPVTASYSELSDKLEAENFMKEMAEHSNTKSRDYEIVMESALDTVKIGDFVKVQFKVLSRKKHEYAYITMLYYQQDGSVLQIFPNKYDPDSRVKTGEIFTIPRNEKKYKLEMTPPAGEEKIVLIASDLPVGLAAENSSFAGPYMFQKKSGAGTKGISIQLNRGKASAVKKIEMKVTE